MAKIFSRDIFYAFLVILNVDKVGAFVTEIHTNLRRWDRKLKYPTFEYISYLVTTDLTAGHVTSQWALLYVGENE